MIYLWAQPEVTQNISAGLGGTPARVQKTHPPGRATSMAFYTGSQGDRQRRVPEMQASVQQASQPWRLSGNSPPNLQLLVRQSDQALPADFFPSEA